MVDGKVRLHCPQLVVLEGRPHALGLLTGAVLGVSVHGLAVILVTAQRCREPDQEVIILFLYFCIWGCIYLFFLADSDNSIVKCVAF